MNKIVSFLYESVLFCAACPPNTKTVPTALDTPPHTHTLTFINILAYIMIDTLQYTHTHTFWTERIYACVDLIFTCIGVPDKFLPLSDMHKEKLNEII